jgi:hypothetical protein
VEGADRVDAEVNLFEIGMAVVLFSGPFFLAAYTLISLWKVVRGNPRALAAVWGVGAAAYSLAWFVDRSAGFTEITNLLFMARSVLLFARLGGEGDRVRPRATLQTLQ